LPYVRLVRRNPLSIVPLAAPVITGERYGGRPIYYSDVIVRADSSFESFADLRGASWAYNDERSQSGYGVTLYHLFKLGETEGYFGEVVRTGAHRRSIRMVAAGEIDASAIDSHVLAVELREHPELATRLRIVGALGPSTIQPVVAAARLPEELRSGVRDALLGMGADPEAREILDYAFVERFTPVGDADYDDIRRMLSAVESARFTRLR
jgi:phosphonate transport system substrate-binding protein